MSKLDATIEAAATAKAEQSAKVSALNGQLETMRKNFQSAQEHVNNEIVELAVRSRVLDALEKLEPKKEVKNVGNKSKVLGNIGREAGSKHPVKKRRRAPTSRA